VAATERKQSKRARKLACRYEGFSLHAGTRVAESSRFGLEKLCRYAARPPLANERLSRLADGPADGATTRRPGPAAATGRLRVRSLRVDVARS
jgi:hypothetical protein